MKGNLLLRKKTNNWKRQWFVIKENVLYTYKASEDAVAVATEVLLGWSVEELKECVDGHPPETLFKIEHKGRPTYLFKADSEAVRER